MTCKYCGKPVRLSPSANERAQAYGGKPSDYTALFPDHATCFVAWRSKDAIELMRRKVTGVSHD